MSWLPSDFGLSGLRAVRDALWLRGTSSLGRGVVLEGRPFVDNQGSLELGDDVFIGSRPVQSHFVVGRGASLALGAGTRVSYGAALSANASISIGRNVRLGPFVVIMDSDFHVAGDRNAEAEAKPIVIGHDVVIESRVTILRGSSIGNGTRVRSGAVVSGQLGAGVIAAGVPASVWSEDADAANLDVLTVAMRALSLSTPPALSDGPDQIPQWDSFGALKLLLALEKGFKITLREEQIKSARCIADLASVVEAARRVRPR